MPYVNLATTKSIDAAARRALRDAIGETITLIPGKSYEVTMIRLTDNADIVKGRSDEPCLFMEVRLFTKTTLEAKKAFTEAISAKLYEILGVNDRYMYINYIELEGWGSGGAYREAGE